MVTRLFALVVFFSFSTRATALFNQTAADINVLKDALQTREADQPAWVDDVSPMLLSTPQHLWVESKDDFAPAVVNVLTTIWTKPGTLIQCPECDQQRMHVTKGAQVHIISGPSSAQDLESLQRDSRYKTARSVIYVRETPSGIEAKIIRISDGAIVWQVLANGAENLNHTKRRLRLVDEIERRKRGEALAYTFIELGFYPMPLTHVSFLEQWGPQNEHLTGITLSLVGPLAALGVTYRYLMPQMPRVQIGGSLLFPIQNAVTGGTGKSSEKDALAVFGGTVQYAFSPTFGVHGYLLTDGTVTAGVSFYNPIWFPFML